MAKKREYFLLAAEFCNYSTAPFLAGFIIFHYSDICTMC